MAGSLSRRGPFRPRSWLLPLLVLLLVTSVATSVWRSSQLGPGLSELGALARVERSREVVELMASEGVGALLSKPGHELLERLGSGGPLPYLSSAWLSLLWERLGWGRSLSAMRGFSLLVGGTGPAALFLMMRFAGLRVALFSSLLLMLWPAWAYGVVVGRGTLPALWLWCGAFYLSAVEWRASPPNAAGRSRWPCPRWVVASALSGAAFGLALAHAAMTLWLLLALLVHHWLGARRRSLAGFRSGFAEVPASLAVGAPVALLSCVLAQPRWWRGGPVDFSRWLFGPLRSSVRRTEFAGAVVDSVPLPDGFTWFQVASPLPPSVLLLSAIGVVASWFTRRRAGPGAPVRDGGALRLCGLLVLLFAALAAWSPGLLAPSPPRILLALPFLAGLAGLGLDWVWRLAPRALPRGLLAGALAIGLGAASWLQPSTISAYRSLLVGGTRHVAERRLARVSDGSELGRPVASLLDGCRDALWVYGPDLSSKWWHRTRWVERAGCRVHLATEPGQADYLIARGASSAGGELVARIARGGVVLWEIRRGGRRPRRGEPRR